MSATLAPIPLSAGEVRRWVGSDFNSMKFGREDQHPDENDTYSMTAHDIISAFVNMGEIWPIAKLVIDNGKVTAASTLFAPGLPDGEHEVYPVPMMSDAEVLERNAEDAERNRIVNVLKALGPKEPNDVWESAYKHVIDDCIKAIGGEA